MLNWNVLHTIRLDWNDLRDAIGRELLMPAGLASSQLAWSPVASNHFGSYESPQMTRMAEGEGSKEPETDGNVCATNGQLSLKTPKTTATDETEDEEEEEEEEPRLKYAPLTKNLTSLYRNGDASSAFLVAGDKMVGFVLGLSLARRQTYTNQCSFTDCWYP
jgi:hypothetical protein